MVRMQVRQRGGGKAQAFLDRSRRNMKDLSATKLEVGFFDPRSAAIAQIFEYGLGDQRERPAMRASRPEFEKAVRKALKVALKSSARQGAFRLSIPAAQRVADWGAKAMREGYRAYSYQSSPPLGPIQISRKRGTEGAGRQLVGVKGERLIGWIEGRVTR